MKYSIFPSSFFIFKLSQSELFSSMLKCSKRENIKPTSISLKKTPTDLCYWNRKKYIYLELSGQRKSKCLTKWKLHQITHVFRWNLADYRFKAQRFISPSPSYSLSDFMKKNFVILNSFFVIVTPFDKVQTTIQSTTIMRTLTKYSIIIMSNQSFLFLQYRSKSGEILSTDGTQYIFFPNDNEYITNSMKHATVSSPWGKCLVLILFSSNCIP